MAGPAMNARTLLIAATALTLMPLAGCGRQASAPPPLAGAALGGPLALTNRAAKPVTEKDFAGRYRAVYFGYSFCPDVCPTTLQALMQGYHAFAVASPKAATGLV